jgi:hypothetical protein
VAQKTLRKISKDLYVGADGSKLTRGRDGNWIYIDCNGAKLATNQYRNDIAERLGLKLAEPKDYLTSKSIKRRYDGK